MGCVMQVGEQAVNVARNAVLAAGWPETRAGHHDRPAVRVEPAGRPLRRAGRDRRRLRRRRRGGRRGDDPGADGRVDGRRQVRLPVRAAGRRPLRRAGRAGAAGHLGRADRRQVGPHPRGHRRVRAALASSSPRGRPPRAASSARSSRCSERRRASIDDASTKGPRDTTLESLAKLKPSFQPEEEGGRVTAGNSSQITDGASALLIMSEEKAAALGLHAAGPLRRVRAGRRRPAADAHRADPRHRARCSSGPGMTLDDIDLVEINEAFASVVLAWEKELHPDMEQGQRQRRRDRPRPPARLLGRPADDDAAQRARAHRRPLRPADDVRGRRHGQRHHHRTPRLGVADPLPSRIGPATLVDSHREVMTRRCRPSCGCASGCSSGWSCCGRSGSACCAALDHTRCRPRRRPGELRKVNVRYRCGVCGVELKLTLAPDEDPPPPRHCLEDMDLVAPLYD